MVLNLVYWAKRLGNINPLTRIKTEKLFLIMKKIDTI